MTLSPRARAALRYVNEQLIAQPNPAYDVLSQAVALLDAAGWLTGPNAVTPTCGRNALTGEPCPNHPRPVAEDVSPQVARLRDLIAGQRAAVEDPHDSPLHHDYAKSRDLPEVRT